MDSDLFKRTHVSMTGLVLRYAFYPSVELRSGGKAVETHDIEGSQGFSVVHLGRPLGSEYKANRHRHFRFKKSPSFRDRVGAMGSNRQAVEGKRRCFGLYVACRSIS